MIGQTFSHYRVIEKLGGGGMGVVYRAEDTRLRRSVAMKVLPPELTRDEEAKERFIVEAQAASALDHPNICTIFEIDETPDGQLYLVMAHYAGETLKKRIERGPLAIDEALDYAIQIAQGLVKAHAAGIVHRDIKPANVLVTTDGLVKIVDFGLAKLLGHTGMTRTGTTLGTVAYMAPEQTMGKEVDERVDIWSLGVVLYEMIAGQIPFKGEHDLAIASAVVNRPAAPLTSVRSGVPIELERVVSRALAKSPADRYQTVADLLSELRRLRRVSDGQSVVTAVTGGQAPHARERLRRAALALLVLASLGALAYVAARRPEPTAVALPRLSNPVQVASSVSFEVVPTWSPDSRMLAYQSNQAGNPDIWIVQADGGPPVNRTPDNTSVDNSPRWSPDGRQIAFWSIRDGTGGVFVMPALAGSARRIATTYESAPVWSPDGTELAYAVRDAKGDWLEIRKLADGTTRRVALPGRRGNQRLEPAWSPDGRFVVYIDARNYTSQVTQLWLLKPQDGSASAFTDGRTMEWSPSWAPDSRTLYYTSNRGGVPDIWQQRFSDDGAPGTPQQVSFGLGVITAAVSPDGKRVAYDQGRGVGNAWRVPVLADRAATWADAVQLTFDNALVEFIAISPDGSQLALSSDRRGNPDLWIMPSGGGELQPLASDPTPDWSPAWSPDGQEVAFYAYRSGNREIWVQPVAGGPARQLTSGQSESVFPRWSPDGKTLAYVSRPGLRFEIWTIGARGGEPRLMAGDPMVDNTDPEFSGDGQWLFFRSDRSGQVQIMRMPLSGGPAEVFWRNGRTPRSSPDGKTIYFIEFSPDRGPGNIWSVSADGKGARAITDLAGKRGNFNTNALATDGKHVYFTWNESASDIWVMDVSTSAR